jgi:biopolymer transport protein ExbD
MPLKMHQDDMPMINLTPMIDIIFQLIIFFMVGARFTEMDKKVDVKVPTTSQATNLPTAPTRFVVNVQRSGELTFNSQPVTLESLVTQLRAARQSQADVNVIVRGDADGPLQNVASVLAACREAGVADVGIAVRPAKQGATRR